MTTGRRPTYPPISLDDTIDEADQPRARITGRVPRVEPTAADLDAAYYDGEGDPRLRDHEDRIAALEKGGRRRSKRRTWAERILSFAGGSAMAVIVWALARADANGDARATAREREDQRLKMIEDVRDLLKRSAKQEGQIDTLFDRLRYYPVQGPTLPPAPTQGTP